MFKDEDEAWDILYDNFFTTPVHEIFRKDTFFPISEIELKAIVYLCEDWDYTFYPLEIG